MRRPDRIEYSRVDGRISFRLYGTLHIEAAKVMLANPDIGVPQIAHRLGVSASTLYRYIPAARTANLPDGFREHVEGKAVS